MPDAASCATAWPGEYGPKVVIDSRCSNSSRSRAWNCLGRGRAPPCSRWRWCRAARRPAAGVYRRMMPSNRGAREPFRRLGDFSRSNESHRLAPSSITAGSAVSKSRFSVIRVPSPPKGVHVPRDALPRPSRGRDCSRFMFSRSMYQGALTSDAHVGGHDLPRDGQRRRLGVVVHVPVARRPESLSYSSVKQTCEEPGVNAGLGLRTPSRRRRR